MIIIFAWLVLALVALGLVFWLGVGYRVRRMLKTRPTIRAGLSLPVAEDGEAAPRVSIVVPAHNEERVIDRCANSLREQRHAAIEIIFVLDRCTDGTRSIIERHATEDDRVVFIDNESCPEDWAGKCNAARVGAERATGAYLLFTDADTSFDPDLVGAAVGLARDRELDLLSILSTLTYDHLFERIAQPVASMNLIGMYPIERVNRREKPRPFANGQFMLFRREQYESIGGHVAVKDDLLEDIAFARQVALKDGRCGIFLADGMLICSMYASLESFRRGWKRIFIEACNRKPDRLRKNAWRVFALGLALPALQLAGIVCGAVMWGGGERASGAVVLSTSVVAWVTQLVVLAKIYTLSGAPPLAAILYPAGAWIVGRAMQEAADDLDKKRPVTWGGKNYVLEAR